MTTLQNAGELQTRAHFLVEIYKENGQKLIINKLFPPEIFLWFYMDYQSPVLPVSGSMPRDKERRFAVSISFLVHIRPTKNNVI